MKEILESMKWLEKKFNIKLKLTINSDGVCIIGNPNFHYLLINTPNIETLKSEIVELVRQIKWLNGSEEITEE